MKLQGERLLPTPRAQAWAALNDPAVLQRCIAGCERMERDGDHQFVTAVSVKLGPVAARFKGTLRLADVVPPQSYTIHFEGQGGVAGFGKGSAQVALADAGEHTRLSYVAEAQVGGKLAQLGSRLIDAAAGKVAADFFTAFEADLRQHAMAPEAAQPVVAAVSGKRPVRVWLMAAGVVLAAAAWWLAQR